MSATRKMLRDMPVVIRSHVDRILRSGRDIDAVLDELATSLRGSLHVASLSEKRVMQIEGAAELTAEGARVLGAEIRAMLAQSVRPESTAPDKTTPSREPSSIEPSILEPRDWLNRDPSWPVVQQWPLSTRCEPSHAPH